MSKPKSGIDHTPRLGITQATNNPNSNGNSLSMNTNTANMISASQQQYSSTASNDLKKQTMAISSSQMIKSNGINAAGSSTAVTAGASSSNGPSTQATSHAGNNNGNSTMQGASQQSLQHVSTVTNLLPRTNISSAYNPYIYTYSRNGIGSSSSAAQKVQDSPVAASSASSDSKRPYTSIQQPQSSQLASDSAQTQMVAAKSAVFSDQQLQQQYATDSLSHHASQQQQAYSSTSSGSNQNPATAAASGGGGRHDLFTQNYRVSNTYRPISAQIINPNAGLVAASATTANAAAIATDKPAVQNVPSTVPSQQLQQQQQQQQLQSQQTQIDMKRPPANQQGKSKLNKSSKSETPFKLGLNSPEQQQQQQQQSQVVGAGIGQNVPQLSYNKPNLQSLGGGIRPVNGIETNVAATQVKGDAAISASGVVADSPSNKTTNTITKQAASTLPDGQWRSPVNYGFRSGTAHSSHGTQQQQQQQQQQSQQQQQQSPPVHQQSQRMMSPNPRTEPSEFLSQNRGGFKHGEAGKQIQQQSQVAGGISQSTMFIKQSQPHSNNLLELGHGRKSQTPKREFIQHQQQSNGNHMTSTVTAATAVPSMNGIGINSLLNGGAMIMGNFPNVPPSIGGNTVKQQSSQQQQQQHSQTQPHEENRVISPMRSKQISMKQEKPPVQLTMLPIQPEPPKQVIIPMRYEPSTLVTTATTSNLHGPMKHKKSFSNMEMNPSLSSSSSTAAAAAASAGQAGASKDPQEMFIIRDQDTGQVYDIRQIDKIDTFSKTHNQEYFDKLKRRHKNAWQGWWNSKRENNLKLLEGAQRNDFDLVQQLLQQRHERADIRADPDFKDENQWASIHYAVANSSPEIVNLLLAHDADINIANDSEETPLILAADKGFDEIVDVFLKSGAEVNMQDNRLNTALHLACRSRHGKCVQLLLDHRHIDYSLRNKDDRLASEMTDSQEIKSIFIEKLGAGFDKKFTSQENRQTVFLIQQPTTTTTTHSMGSTHTASSSVGQQASEMPKRQSYSQENNLSGQHQFQHGKTLLKNQGVHGAKKFQSQDSAATWQSQQQISSSSYKQGLISSQSAAQQNDQQDRKASLGGGGVSSSSSANLNQQINSLQHHSDSSPPPQSGGGGSGSSSSHANKQSMSSQGSCSSNTLSNGSNFYTSGLSGSGIQIAAGSSQLAASGSSSASSASAQPWRVMIHDYPNESIMKLFASTDSTDFQAVGGEGFSSVSMVENAAITYGQSMVQHQQLQQQQQSQQSMNAQYGMQQQQQQKGQQSQQMMSQQHHKGQSLEVPSRSNSEMSSATAASLTGLSGGSGGGGGGAARVGPESFRIVNQIGRGSFGEVYLVEKKGTSTYYAMKMLHKSKVVGQNLTKYAMTERNVLSIMSHPFIVKLMFAFQTSKDLFLIMEFMPGGDLSHALQRDKRFSESRARIYLVEILLAIRHLHKNDIIYRDLKPENIVIDAEGHAMLTDFGLSKDGIYDHYSTHSFCGSLAYLAPEMLKRCGHGKAVDYYHLGVLLYEMLTGTPPFFSDSKDDICHNIEFAELRFPSHVSDNARNLISRFLVKNPSKRLGFGKNDFEEIKRHQFFSGINWTQALQRKLKPPPAFIKPIVESKNKSTPNFMMTMTPLGMTTDNHVSGWTFINNFNFDPNVPREQQQLQMQQYVQQQQQSQQQFHHNHHHSQEPQMHLNSQQQSQQQQQQQQPQKFTSQPNAASTAKMQPMRF